MKKRSFLTSQFLSSLTKINISSIAKFILVLDWFSLRNIWSLIKLLRTSISLNAGVSGTASLKWFNQPNLIRSTNIITTLQSGLDIQPLLLCALILYMSDGSYSLKSIPNDRFLGSYSWEILLSEICLEEGAAEIFSYFRFGVWPDVWTQALCLINQHTTY